MDVLCKYRLIIFKKSLLFKGTFLSESTDAFVITPNRWNFFFPETENLSFGDFWGYPSQPKAAFLPLQVSKLWKFKTSSISKQFSVTKIQTFSFSRSEFQKRKMFICLELWQKDQYLLTKTYLCHSIEKLFDRFVYTAVPVSYTAGLWRAHIQKTAFSPILNQKFRF